MKQKLLRHLKKTPLIPLAIPLYIPLICLMLAFALCSSSALGQASQGAVAGTVTDASGAVVPHVKIIATEIHSGVVYNTESNGSGDYRFPNMSIGTYNISASASGYKEQTAAGVAVQLASTTPLDIKLQVGSVAEKVTVEADAPTIQTESADIGIVVTEQQIQDLPLAVGDPISAMRSPENFVFLSPGTVGPGTSNGNGGAFESKISGGQNYSTEVLLDGISTYRSENGSSFDETAPSVDALGQFKLVTSTIPAELGRTTGGIEIFGTKAGTNDYHGTAYDFFINEDLNANSWSNNYYLSQQTTAAGRAIYQRPLDRKNDYGVTLGGPVRIPWLYNGKDKTFFFFSWEQFRQNQGGISTTTVPTTAERSGNFQATEDLTSNLGTNPCDGSVIHAGEVFDPSTTRTLADGTVCRTAFANNIVPSSAFSTIGTAILANYPDPQNGNALNNYSFPFSYPILDTSMTARGDQTITSKQKFYFTYNSRDNTRLSTNPIFPNVAGGGRQQDFFTHFIRSGYDYAISPSLLESLIVGYNRTNSGNFGAGVRSGVNWVQKFGLTGASGTTFPAINVYETGITAIGDNVDGDTIDNGLRLIDSVTWIKGRHDFKVGVDYRYQQYNAITFANSTGTVNFARAETAADKLTNATSGNAVASLLLGTPDFGSLTEYASQPKWLSSYRAFYFQDSWKVTPSLLINYGLRWDEDQPRRANHGDTSNISLTAPNPGAGGLPGALVFAGKGTGRTGDEDERWADIWHKDFGPRIGFAYAPKYLNNKTVLRGGFATYYAALTYADFGADLLTGFQANPSFSNNGDGISPAFNLSAGFPAYAKAPDLDPTQSNFTGPILVKKTYGRPAMIDNWSLEIQQQVATDLIADIAYVGQHSAHLRSNFDGVNSINPSKFALGNTLNAAINSPAATSAGVNLPFSTFPTTQSVSQALRPFPQYFGFNTDCCLENEGQASYDSLQASLQRRFHNGLNLLASYTWSKDLTDADSALPYFATLHGGGSPQNPFNKRGDKAVSNQDIPQTLVVSYLYQLPIGKGKKFLGNSKGVTNRLVGGWEISGIHRYQSGQPISFGGATGIPSWDDTVRFDRVPGQPLTTAASRHKSSFNVLAANTSIAPCSPNGDGTFTANPEDSNRYYNCGAFRDQNAGNLIAGGAPYTLGDMPRTTTEIRSFNYLNEDFSFIKRTPITERVNLEFQADMLDAFNRHIFDRAVSDGPYNSDFGFVNITDTVSGPRLVQFHLKLQF
jgi:hypothetical protein